MIIPTGTKLPPTDWNAVLAEIVTAQPVQIIPMPLEEWRGDGSDMELTLSAPGPKAQHIAHLIGDQAIGEAIDATTDHAWLVVLGYFAQALALIAELETVPLAQRPGSDCGPQTKLIEFLVGILGGIEYLQDLNKAAQPIATDATVNAAWAQDTFVHYSGVSRTLKAAAEDTLAAVVQVLQAVSRPYLDAAVLETLRDEGQLIVDVDLTGREVSPTSTDYPEAGFGWMGADTGKGYQAAVTSLVCARWTRLLLTLQRYAGRTQSAACLQAAVQAVEQLLGVRPRRRVELVQERRDRLNTQIQQLHTKLTRIQQAADALWQRLREVRAAIPDLQDEVVAWEAVYQAQGRAEKRHCRLAKARRKLTALQQREQRAWRDLKKLHRQRDQYQRKLSAWQDELLALDEWWDYLETDNRSNCNPVTIVLRIDAGFSTGPNLAWLIEMGYIVLTKAHHGSTAHSLRQQVEPQTAWTRVGGNAEAVYMGDYQHHDCPYPLQAMLVRYHLPEKIRYTTLFYYDETPPPPLPAWFAQYNGRQTIEAGIKEGKAVFTLKRHLVRSPIGMQLQEQFALFGANFVRWAAAWVKDLLHRANHDFITALGQVKTLVRTVSRARARWVCNALGHTLIFDERGPFAGTTISLSGQVAVQLALPLFSFALF